MSTRINSSSLQKPLLSPAERKASYPLRGRVKKMDQKSTLAPTKAGIPTKKGRSIRDMTLTSMKVGGIALAIIGYILLISGVGAIAGACLIAGGLALGLTAYFLKNKTRFSYHNNKHASGGGPQQVGGNKDKTLKGKKAARIDGETTTPAEPLPILPQEEDHSETWGTYAPPAFIDVPKRAQDKADDEVAALDERLHELNKPIDYDSTAPTTVIETLEVTETHPGDVETLEMMDVNPANDSTLMTEEEKQQLIDSKRAKEIEANTVDLNGPRRGRHKKGPKYTFGLAKNWDETTTEPANVAEPTQDTHSIPGMTEEEKQQLIDSKRAKEIEANTIDLDGPRRGRHKKRPKHIFGLAKNWDETTTEPANVAKPTQDTHSIPGMTEEEKQQLIDSKRAKEIEANTVDLNGPRRGRHKKGPKHIFEQVEI